MNRSFVVVGDETLTVECISLLIEAGHTVPLVITRSPRVASFAEGRGLPHRRGLREPLPACDYVLSAANLRMLPRHFLEAPGIAAINFHDGPLPGYAGINAPVWAIVEGAREFGVTWHRMTDEPDAGAILEQELFELDPEETALSLNTRCFEAAQAAFRRLLPRLESGDVEGAPQDRESRTYYGFGRPLPNGGVIDPRDGADAVSRLVRATDFGSYPNPVGSAWLAHGRNAVRVTSSVRGPGTAHSPIGSCTPTGDRIALQCPGGLALLGGFSTAAGRPLGPREALEHLGISDGGVIRVDDLWLEAGAGLAASAAASERAALDALSAARTELPFLKADTRATAAAHLVPSGVGAGEPAHIVAALGQFVAGLTGADARLWVAAPGRAIATAAHRALFDPFVPVTFALADTPAQASGRASAAVEAGPTWRDLSARIPPWPGLPKARSASISQA